MKVMINVWVVGVLFLASCGDASSRMPEDVSESVASQALRSFCEKREECLKEETSVCREIPVNSRCRNDEFVTISECSAQTVCDVGYDRWKESERRNVLGVPFQCLFRVSVGCMNSLFGD